jgi:hypothetical protein
MAISRIDDEPFDAYASPECLGKVFRLEPYQRNKALC